MESDPRRSDYRKALRRREFGADPTCILCGVDDPVVFHHIAGAANDCIIEAPHCLNCHELEHEGMRYLGVDLKRDKPRTILDVILALLQGLAVFCRLMSEWLEARADKLAGLLAALDATLPAWRDLEEAW